MKIDILTIFPEMFKGPFAESIIKRAMDKNLVEIKIHNLRKWSKDRHQSVDDRPYGGGKGMVMMVEPIAKAIASLKSKIQSPKSKVILLTPRGKLFNQKKAQDLSKFDHLILICGHYEGVDERVSKLVDEEISIGDYVLTGGEIPGMVLVDAVVRLIPRVLEKEAVEEESFSDPNLLEYPQYTRPEVYKKWRTPKVLLSGNPKLINDWRQKEALKKTKKSRPDLLKK
jgi:tRNA (guanine37-N1)-methyltransferase